ncbi:hypothetical protein [Aquimarina sp. I32.4]|uniref:hypothetical protein n=1 Tax=Aquimarina sp. I32.4 TaxID=2053903 RepID=UPI000CDE5FB2|nr:hypothetical protein [Aquimarina sp. I32.4]
MEIKSKLWEQIKNYDLDAPLSNYGFSTRLASENNWTIDFTKKAILEYKKFMYLAVISRSMVSPSEIVDIVWHQHLIFTHSYTAFCKEVKKRIQHKPSIHKNANEIKKFKEAKKRTTDLYNKNFGKQPKEFWRYNSIYEPLSLEKSKMRIPFFLLLNAILLVFIITILYSPLKSIYSQIDNPYFLLLYIPIVVGSYLILNHYNKTRLLSLIYKWDKDSFIFKLEPMELVYLSKKNLKDVSHGVLNEMIKDDKIDVTGQEKLRITKKEPEDVVENAIYSTLKDSRKDEYYIKVIDEIVSKPVFQNIAESMGNFQQYFVETKEYFQLFSFNLYIILFFFMIAFVRLLTGISGDKPITFLVVTLIGYIIFSWVYLSRFKDFFMHKTIPEYYRSRLIHKLNDKELKTWDYFRYEKEALVGSFIPIVNYTSRNHINSSGSGCGSSCGSSCSSCSSCGGCGGCGD